MIAIKFGFDIDPHTGQNRGVSSGIGLAAAKELSSAGHRAVGVTLRAHKRVLAELDAAESADDEDE